MLVSILSVKGSPGVTSFAVALAARWPEPARTVVVEADPSGGDLGLRFSLPGTGLVSLAAAARHAHNGHNSSGDSAVNTAGRGADGEDELVWSHAQQLPGGLAVVNAPPDADQARAALAALTPTATDAHSESGREPDGRGSGRTVLHDAADAPNTVVIVDCGRADSGSPALSIARSSDVVVVLSRADADDLAHLPRRLDAIGRWGPTPVLLLVGNGYRTATIARELGITPLGRIPHDPRGAQMLCGRPPRWRRRRSGPAHSALGTTAHQVALTLASQVRPAPAETGTGEAGTSGAGAAVSRGSRMAVLHSVPGAPTVGVPRQHPKRPGAVQ